MEIFNQIATKIILEQELVIGPMAWSEAQKVIGLVITTERGSEVRITNLDPGLAVDQLVGRYERLFGRASHEVCREAVASLIANMKPEEIPASLR